jgi:hypothetical protein
MIFSGASFLGWGLGGVRWGRRERDGMNWRWFQ